MIVADSFSLLQSEWWARVKGQQGWNRVARDGPSRVILERRVGPLRLWYAPHAAFPTGSPELATAIARNLGSAPRKPHLLRWDIPYQDSSQLRRELVAAGLSPAPVRVQPPDTVVVDLTPDESSILGAMKSKTRYNARLAAKRGVEFHRHYHQSALGQLKDWYNLYRETAARDRIAIHSYNYYRSVVSIAVEMRDAGEAAPEIVLHTATHEGELLAGLVVVHWEGMATYLYGASSNHKRNLMASYGLQWEAMRTAKHAGLTGYDMFGIPPSDDPHHPMHGLYRFKTGFGGHQVHRPGCWDFPVRQGAVAVYHALERLRSWYYLNFRKRR